MRIYENLIIEIKILIKNRIIKGFIKNIYRKGDEMKSLSIYTLTRNQNIGYLPKLERQLSGREEFLKFRSWELDSMKALVCQLEKHMVAEIMPEVCSLRFFYSFQIPRLGKEFDLLQIKDSQIVNIELKSGVVSDEAIRKQLMQNRYYLSVLGKPIQSYTYISSQNRLVRLTNHDHIKDADWERLCMDLQKDGRDYEGDIEDLFRAELYLISPVADPVRFLKKEYFLTSQQRDIERKILRELRMRQSGYFWFNGLPGTGKTLLLYDIAMKLSSRHLVCMIHCEEANDKWKILHERLRRIDFLSDKQLTKNGLLADKQQKYEQYSAILVDEAHLLSTEKMQCLLKLSKGIPVIFSSDAEEVISPEEMDRSNIEMLENLPDIKTFRLTNRIRTNAELSTFIQNMMHLPERKNQKEYPHISVVYANNEDEAEILLSDYRGQGYQYTTGKYELKNNKEVCCEQDCQVSTKQLVRDFKPRQLNSKEQDCQDGTRQFLQTVQPKDTEQTELEILTVRDIEQLVVLLDERYYYDESGHLRTVCRDANGNSYVRTLFHKLNQAKEKIAFVIKNNEQVYGNLLDLLQ